MIGSGAQGGSRPQLVREYFPLPALGGTGGSSSLCRDAESIRIPAPATLWMRGCLMNGLAGPREVDSESRLAAQC